MLLVSYQLVSLLQSFWLGKLHEAQIIWNIARNPEHPSAAHKQKPWHIANPKIHPAETGLPIFVKLKVSTLG